MLFQKYFSILPTLILAFSCSSSFGDHFLKKEDTRKRNEALIKSFDGEEEVLAKFKQKSSLDAGLKIEKSEVKVEPGSTKKVNKASRTKKISQLAAKKNNASHSSIKNKQIAKQFVYPKKYPEKYKEIDLMTLEYWTKIEPKVFEGEKTQMDLNYMGVSTGKVVITTQPATTLGSNEVYHFHARVKTSSYYSYLYELDDNVESFVDKKTFTPVKFSLIQRESSQNVDDLQLFDKETLTTYVFHKRDRDGEVKKSKKVKPTPTRFQDALSVLFYLRGLPYKKDEQYIIPLMNKGKVLILKAISQKIEEIDTNIGKKEAIKVLASTQYSGETLKSGNMTFWFSNDDKRVFLRFNAEVKIGSISGDIEKYER
jgi:hypothetical protein